MFIFLSDSSEIPVSLLLRNIWSLVVGLTAAFTLVFNRRSCTFLRKVSFSALATSLGDVTILSSFYNRWCVAKRSFGCIQIIVGIPPDCRD